MKTMGTSWQWMMALALPLLVLSGSGSAFAGSASLGCFEPKSGTDGGGDVSIDGDTDEGSVHAELSPEELAKFRAWLFGDDINAAPPGGWPSGVGGLSGTGGTAGTAGSGGSTGSGGTAGSAGASGSGGATGTGGTTGSGGSGGNCSSEGGQCPTLPSCEDIRTTVFAHPAESVTRTHYRLNITFSPMEGFVLTAVETAVPIPLPTDTQASLLLTGDWAIPPGHYPLIDGQLTVPIVRIRR